jgi:hypothetical protein
MAKSLAVATLLGLGVVIALIGYFGANPVLSAFETVGWGALLVIGVRAVETSSAGLAWAWLMPRATRPPARIFMLLRWLRESINCLLPVAQVAAT